jgi:hypothetical protein
MIHSIFLFNLQKELILKKEYSQNFNYFVEISDLIVLNLDFNFMKFGDKKLIYKKYDELIVTFLVEGEDEMFILSSINLLMSAMDRLLGNLNQKSFIYHFKDVSYAVDNFVINGKIINLDHLDISTTPHFIKPEDK